MAGLIPFNKKKRTNSKSNTIRPFNMIDDFFDETFSNLPTINKNFLTGSFKVDVIETSNEYVVEAELPDIKRQEISLSLDDNRLSIAVERNEETETTNEDKSYIHKERHFNSMRRSVYLENADADSNKVEATLENGLLEVTIPKDKKMEQPDHSQRIEIK